MTLVDNLHDLGQGLRFAAAVPGLLRLQVDLDQPRAELRRRFEARGANFLTLLREGVYAQESSPYHQLLSWAGCEYGDVERLVETEGLEGPLQALFQAGVYLTFEELRGTVPARRGSHSVPVRLERLINPRVARGLVVQRAARNRITGFNLDRASFRENVLRRAVYEEIWGSSRSARASWAEMGSIGLSGQIRNVVLGIPSERQFTTVDPASSRLPRRYRWAARWLRWCGLLLGKTLPSPEYVPPDHPEPILRWVEQTLRAGRPPVLHTHPSSAVRLAGAAAAAGIRLDGLRFSLYGEPLTPGRARALRDLGATASANYSSHESGNLGRGCLNAFETDEVHLLTDTQAVIQPGDRGPDLGLRPNTLLISSLDLNQPFLLVNASIGDEAVLTSRDCGCPFEEAGWTTHLHTIRSFEKLTTGGMTFIDSDVVRVLEEALPARFGGGPLSYQLVEDELEDGQAALRLLVDPALGPLDEGQIIEAFLDGIEAPSTTAALMGEQWREAGFVRVERRAPVAAQTGKIAHLLAKGHAPADTPAPD